MNARSVLLTAIWALGAFGLAMAVGVPGDLDAVDQPRSVAPPHMPVLRVHGIDFSAARIDPTTQPSDEGIDPGRSMLIRLNAVNITDQPQTADFTLTAWDRTKGSPFSRVPIMQRQVWTVSGNVVLNAQSSKVLTFAISPIDATGVVSIAISSGKEQVVAFTIPLRPKMRSLENNFAQTLLASPGK